VFLTFLYEKRLPQPGAWPGDSSALLDFFRLNLETLVLRFHHFYTVERPMVSDGKFQIWGEPMNGKTLPWGIADQDVADGTQEWYQEVFYKSEVYKAAGDGKEVSLMRNLASYQIKLIVRNMYRSSRKILLRFRRFTKAFDTASHSQKIHDLQSAPSGRFFL